MSKSNKASAIPGEQIGRLITPELSRLLTTYTTADDRDKVCARHGSIVHGTLRNMIYRRSGLSVSAEPVIVDLLKVARKRAGQDGKKLQRLTA